MDLEEWEYIPDEGFLEIHDDGGKKIFSRNYVRSPKNVFNMDYFRCPSPKLQKFVDSTTQEDEDEPSLPSKQLIPLPIQLDYPVSQELEDITKVSFDTSEEKLVLDVIRVGEGPGPDQDPVSQVFFKKMKENEFVDMKIIDSPVSPRSGSTRGFPPHIETTGAAAFQFEGKTEEGAGGMKSMCTSPVHKEMVKVQEEIAWDGSNEGHVNVWKMSLSGIGAICSFGMVAATICIIIFGSGGQKSKQQQNQKMRFQIYSDDKNMKQVVHQATKLNDAISAARGVPLTRAHITHGGYYEAL